MQAAGVGAEGDGFRRRQLIGNDAAANDDLIGCVNNQAGSVSQKRRRRGIVVAQLLDRITKPQQGRQRPKLSRLTELGNSCAGLLQRCRAYGAAG